MLQSADKIIIPILEEKRKNQRQNLRINKHTRRLPPYMLFPVCRNTGDSMKTKSTPSM